MDKHTSKEERLKRIEEVLYYVIYKQLIFSNFYLLNAYLINL